MCRNIIVGVFAIFLLVTSCAKVDNCPEVACNTPTQTLKLNIIDSKNTSSLIGNSSEKSTNNLTIYSTRLKRNIDYRLETIKDGTSYVVFETSGTDELEITLNDFSADILKVETKYIDKDCCGSLELVKLSMNNAMISIPSDNVIVISK